jgi:glutathione S-transferase
VRLIRARLYWFPISHPAQAVRRMLDLKGIEYELAPVLPGTQRIHLRLVGFRGGTVPAMRLDGRRLQGSRPIARALERIEPQPPLFPADSHERARVEEAERWGDEELQPVPRRLVRWGLVRYVELRRWFVGQSGMPGAPVMARLTVPVAHYYANAVGANEAAARRHLEQLPDTLARVDGMLADGVLVTAPPSAAALQVLCSVRSLDSFADLHEHVSTHPCAAAARELFPDYPGPVPRFLPAGWLAGL